MKKFKLPFNRIWLLILGVVLALAILGYGNAQYQKEINKPTDNYKLTENEIGSNTKLEPADDSNNSNEQVDKLTKKQDIDQNNQEIIEQSNNDNSNNPNTSDNNTDASNNSDSDSHQQQQTYQYVNLNIQAIGNYQVEYQQGDNGWQIMQRAAAKHHFHMTYQVYDFGIYIVSIGGIEPEYGSYWALYYNDNYSIVGIADLKVTPNDTIKWQVESWQ